MNSMVKPRWTYDDNTVKPWWFYHDNIAYRLTTKWLCKKFDLLEFQQCFFLKRPLCNLFICFFGQWGETYKIIFFSIWCIASWSQSFCSLRASKEITILVQIQYVCTHNFTLLWCCIQHIPPTLSWWMHQESPCYRQMVPCYHKRFIMFSPYCFKMLSSNIHSSWLCHALTIDSWVCPHITIIELSWCPPCFCHAVTVLIPANS